MARFHRGELPPEQASAVSSHLVECAICRERRDTGAAHEQLLREIRSLAGAAELLLGARRAGATPADPEVDSRLDKGDTSSQAWPRIDGFRVLRLIGSGGMGVIYEAEQDLPRRRVAVKMMAIGSDKDRSGSLRRAKLFVREAEALGRLNHPDIAAVYAAGECDGGLPYIALELVEGLRLDEYLAQLDPSPSARLRLMARICRAVHYAHVRGVVHRDLKPGNILISAAGEPKILDFGLAKLVGERLADEPVHAAVHDTVLNEVAGTAGYMSPEQLRGELDQIDARSDVYALGALARHCLWDSGDCAERRSLGRADALLKRVTSRAMSAEPGLRQQTASELANDLDRAAARTDKSRHGNAGRWGIVAAAVLVLLLSGGAWWLVGRTTGAPSLPPPSPNMAPPSTASAGKVVLGPGLVVSDLQLAERAGEKRIQSGEIEAAPARQELTIYAMIFDQRSDAPEAERVMRLVLDRESPRQESRMVDQARLSRILAAQGRPDEVEELLRIADSVIRSRDHGRWWEIIATEAAAARARVHRAAGRYSEAERMLIDHWAALEEPQSSDAATRPLGPARMRRASAKAFLAQELVCLYQAAERPTDADRWAMIGREQATAAREEPR